MIEKKLKDHEYIEKTNLFVKILLPYLRNSHLIKNPNLRNEFIDAIYVYLNRIDKKWRKCSFLKQEQIFKRQIITHKKLLKTANRVLN